MGPGFVVKASWATWWTCPPAAWGWTSPTASPPVPGHPRKGEGGQGAQEGPPTRPSGLPGPRTDRGGEGIAHAHRQQLGPAAGRLHRCSPRADQARHPEGRGRAQKLNQRLYDSQQARRVLDRLVGYQISPLLWDKVKRGLSAGRVQSVALRLVVDREREVRAFVPQEYWDVTAHLAAQLPPPFKAKVAKLGGKKFEPRSQAEAQAAIDALQGAAYLVAGIKKRRRQQRPAPPFITSTLQQEAFRKLGLSPKRTMALAQRLYEAWRRRGPGGLIPTCAPTPPGSAAAGPRPGRPSPAASAPSTCPRPPTSTRPRARPRTPTRPSVPPAPPAPRSRWKASSSATSSGSTA